MTETSDSAPSDTEARPSVEDPSPAGGSGSRSSSPRIVVFGGGTGMAALLRGLKKYTEYITAVVTVTDNGGSSGRLRNDFDMAAPGDIRNCLIALADIDPLIGKVFQYRFDEAEFKGHCFGNLFITVLTRVVGEFEASIRELNRLLRVRGKVVPASNAKVSLVAHHPDGSKSTGEVQITRSGKPISEIELRPQPVTLSPEIRQAVEEADLFLFGPGSLFTSVIPNLLIDGVMDAINETGKPRVYIGNIMTQPGETLEYKLSDHILAIRRHVGDDFPDVVVAHSGEVPLSLLKRYGAQGSELVVHDLDRKDEFEDVRVIQGNFLSVEDYRQSKSARHDSTILARVIHEEFLQPLDRGGECGPAISNGGESEGKPVQAHGTRALR